MKKPTLAALVIMAGLVIGSVASAQMGGGISVPSFFKKAGDAVLFTNGAWTLGSAGSRVAGIYATTLDVTSAVIGGSVTGDLTITGSASATKYIANPGSAAAPSFTFSGDTDTGIYSNTGGSVVLDSNGSTSLIAATNQVTVYGTLAPDANNTRDIGSSSNSWASIYASGTASIKGAVMLSGKLSLYTVGSPYTGSWLDFNYDTGSNHTAYRSEDGSGGFVIDIGSPLANHQMTVKPASAATANVADFGFLYLTPTYSRTSGNGGKDADLLINRTETMVTTGTQSFADFRVGNGSRYRIDNYGIVFATSSRQSVSNGLTASTTLALTGSYIYVSSTAGVAASILSASSSVATSTNNDAGVSRVCLVGTDDTATVTVYDNSNVQLGAASRVLGSGDILCLSWNYLRKDYFEESFVNN